MKLLVLIIAVLIASVLMALYAVEDPGYVLISRAPWSIEMALTLFIPLLLLGFAALYLLLYISLRLFRIPRDVTAWRNKRHRQQARAALNQGLINLAEGNWMEAEAQLLSSMRYSDAPLLSYLGAACASEGHGNAEKRDEYLALAHKSAPQNPLATGLIQAYLQIQAHQYEQALATLTELRLAAPKHKLILKMLCRVYSKLRDWTGLVDLIPALRRNNVMSQKEIDALELQAHRELLTLSLPSGSLNVLKKAWNAIPKTLRRHPTLIVIYARQLIQQNQIDEAEPLLHAAIDAEWDDTLVELYGKLRPSNAMEKLETAEEWLSTHPENPTLHLTLARLAMQNNLEGKARTYLEKCISLRGPMEAYREFGELLERLGEPDAARECYRHGLEAYADERRPASERNSSGLGARHRAAR